MKREGARIPDFGLLILKDLSILRLQSEPVLLLAPKCVGRD